MHGGSRGFKSPQLHQFRLTRCHCEPVCGYLNQSRSRGEHSKELEIQVDWTSEGFALDDAGNLIMTAYIDLRNEEDRLPIPALVKGCKTEYALENGGTLLLSKPARFRDFGENLIRDDQEGLAKEEMVAAVEQTPAQAMRQRAIADMNEALELAGGGTILSSTYKETLVESDRSVKRFEYGKGWWIFCASIEPKEDEWGDMEGSAG